jgi:hypothetical protein
VAVEVRKEGASGGLAGRSLIGSTTMLADARGEGEETTIPSEAEEMFLFKRDSLQSERS